MKKIIYLYGLLLINSCRQGVLSGEMWTLNGKMVFVLPGDPDETYGEKKSHVNDLAFKKILKI
jgi:hypothetical protein